MTYSVATEELAQRAAAYLAATPDRPIVELTRPTARYVVQRYGDGWGVVRRWRNADRPDLGEFGGAFEVLKPKYWNSP